MNQVAPNLGDMFERSESGVVDWHGRVVHAVLRFPVEDGSSIRLRRLASSKDRAQAVKIAANKGGELSVNGTMAKTVAIWSHNAPVEVEIGVHGRRASSIDVWNAWSLDGVDNAWLGNAGIVVQSHAGGHTLQCSDGVGEADFTNLVMWLGIDVG